MTDLIFTYALTHISKYRLNPFKIGVSAVSDAIPAYAFIGEFYFNRQEQFGYTIKDSFLTPAVHIKDDIFMYHKPENYVKKFPSTRYLTTFQQLITQLTSYSGHSKFRFTVAGEEKYLNVFGGYLSDDEDNILLLLTVKKENFMLTNLGNRVCLSKSNIFVDRPDNPSAPNELKVDKFRLYISSELISNPTYKNFYKRLDKEFIQPNLQKGVEVLITTSQKIENSIYSNNFKIEGETIEEINNSLKEKPLELLLMSEKDFLVELNVSDALNNITSTSTGIVGNFETTSGITINSISSNFTQDFHNFRSNFNERNPLEEGQTEGEDTFIIDSEPPSEPPF